MKCYVPIIKHINIDYYYNTIKLIARGKTIVDNHFIDWLLLANIFLICLSFLLSLRLFPCMFFVSL